MAAPWVLCPPTPILRWQGDWAAFEGAHFILTGWYWALILFMAEGPLGFEHHAPRRNKEGKQASVLPSGPLTCLVGSEPNKIPWEF